MTERKVEIILPGYDCLVPNEVYKKDSAFDPNLLILSRYTLLSSKKVNDSIKRTIKDFMGVLPVGMGQKLMSPLEQAILQLPDETKAELLSEDLWPVTETEDRNYIETISCCIPTSALSQPSAKKDTNFYIGLVFDEASMYPDSARQFNAQIQLKDSMLPDKHELDILIKNKTRMSEMFNIVGSQKFPYSIQHIADTIYSAIKSPVYINALADVTNDANNALALTRLQNALCIIKMENFSRAFMPGGSFPPQGPKGPVTLH